MRSRNYSVALAASSFLLLVCACDSSKVEERKADAPREIVVEAPPVLEDPNDEDLMEEGADDGEGSYEHHDGCDDEEMRFEGKCYPKKAVKDVVEQREADALQDVQNADDPAKAAKATNVFLEQQINQAAKTEDDLDEILEILKEDERRRSRKEKSK